MFEPRVPDFDNAQHGVAKTKMQQPRHPTSSGGSDIEAKRLKWTSKPRPRRVPKGVRKIADTKSDGSRHHNTGFPQALFMCWSD